ncbi:unnamed protein product [Rangifer tarandus platyrhynchus]|uniref:Uncharacterized protein n=2 Tax=Rangifer tarandus platyrhynchus TaxID=3082113 RepID=A0ACB0DQ46_RANTA|nr:unnamed protein product [Rangifer tarandus platyrhynchus]CAI9690367.1 unnamed protein product [Rangifer tarandus platyrhynchus]
MRPCPTSTLQMELPFTGRSPQIGIKVPPNRQGQRGPGVHSRRLTKLLAGVLRGTKYPLSDPPKVMSSRSGRLGQCGEEKTKVSSRQRKPGQLLEQPLPYSPRQPRGSAAKMADGWGRGPVLQQGTPDTLTSEKPSNLLLHRRKLAWGEIPQQPIKLSGAEGPPANDPIPDEPPVVSFDKQKFRILKQSEFLVFSYVIANFLILFKKSLQLKVTKKFSHV